MAKSMLEFSIGSISSLSCCVLFYGSLSHVSIFFEKRNRGSGAHVHNDIAIFQGRASQSNRISIRDICYLGIRYAIFGTCCSFPATS